MTTDAHAVLADLAKQLETARPHLIGYPGATDYPPWEPLREIFGFLLNNYGDPRHRGGWLWHTKEIEDEVVDWVAKLFRAPTNYWGYVTTGGTEGNIAGIRIGRAHYPNAMVYYWTSAHDSVAHAVDLLGMKAVRLRVTDPYDHADLDDFESQLARHRYRPAIVVATAGTTMTESFDRVRDIIKVLERACVPYYLHADAALSGIPLGLLQPEQARPSFDFADGAHSMAVSTHKFLGTPEPGGVFVVRDGFEARVTRPIDYAGSPRTTIGGSRSGHLPLWAWWAIQHWGYEGLSRRAQTSRDLATHTYDRLRNAGWICTYNSPGFTVVLKGLPEPIKRKWVLATSGDRSHVIAMPGIGTRLDEFVDDLLRVGRQHHTYTGRVAT